MFRKSFMSCFATGSAMPSTHVSLPLARKVAFQKSSAGIPTKTPPFFENFSVDDSIDCGDEGANHCEIMA